jgi:perosamine synthetase
MKKIIAISLSPNVEKKDTVLALQLLLSPKNYNKAEFVEKLDEWFQTFFNTKYAFSYTSGRAGLFEILQAYDIGEGDEVIVQAFTCVALPNAILATKATPVYVDVLANATMDPKDIEQKISKKTKAIIVQHTFGIPSEIEKIQEIAKKHNIKVIEDCAHGIGVSYKNKMLGQFGDCAFFSFGRDKAFSSVFGGMVITNDKNLAEKLEKKYKEIPLPSKLWTAQQLFHPIAFSLIIPLYDTYSIGKMLLIFFQKLHFLSFPVTGSEKKGKYAKADTKRLPGALAKLAFTQLERLKTFNKTREQISALYMSELADIKESFLSSKKLPYLRFSLLSERRDEIVWNMRKHHIYLGKWYGSAIDPKGVDFATIQYTVGSCPKAEWLASRIFNLPTYPLMSEEDAKHVVKLLKRYV